MRQVVRFLLLTFLVIVLILVGIFLRSSRPTKTSVVSILPGNEEQGATAKTSFIDFCQRINLGRLLEEYYQVPFVVKGGYVFYSFSVQNSCLLQSSLNGVPLSIVVALQDDQQKEIFLAAKNAVLPPPAETVVEAIDASGDFISLRGEAFYQKDNLLVGYLPAGAQSWTLWFHKEGKTLAVNSLVENNKNEAGAKSTLQKIVQAVWDEYQN